MIHKIHKSRPTFKSILQYACDKKDGEIIGGNTPALYTGDLIKEFSFYENLNTRVENPVFHASLSLAPDERLTNEQWQDAAETYLKKLGLDPERHAYTIIRHNDTDNDHIHIIASRVGYTGKVGGIRGEKYVDENGKEKWRDANRGRVGMECCRELEKKFGLKPPKAQAKTKTSRTDQEILKSRGEIMTEPKSFIQYAIDEIIKKHTFDLNTQSGRDFFTEQLKTKGIEVKYQKAGAAFKYTGQGNNIFYSGTKLGTDYKFKKLTARALHQSEPQQNAAIPAQARELPQKREPNYQKAENDFYELLITFTTGIVKQILIWLKRARQKAEAEKRAAEQAQRELQKQFNFLSVEILEKIGDRLIKITENEIKRREAAEQKAAEQLQKTQNAAEYGAGSAAPFGSAESPNAEKSTSTSVNNEKPAIDEPPRAENTPPGKTLGGVEKSTMTTEKQTQSPTATPKADNSTPPPEKRAAGVELTAEQKRAEQKERIKQKTAEIAAKINAEIEKEKREAAERKAAEIERQTQRTQQTSKRRGR